MTVYIDADACPVVKIAVEEAKKKSIPVVLVCDVNHILSSDYATVVTVDAGSDSADYAIVNRLNNGDVVITQDYGVAAMAMSKKAYVIHQSGTVFDESNIDSLLAQRHMASEARRKSSKNHLKGPKKRTAEDDRRFSDSFVKLLENVLNQERPE